MTKFSTIFVPRSLRGQLLLWLISSLLLIGAIAIYDGYSAARTTADSVSDRVLSGSALAIAERVFVNDDNQLEVDIPYIALQMLTSSEDDRVFYRIEDAEGKFVTGYKGLELPKLSSKLSEVSFHDGTFRGDPIRIATYSGAASSNTKSLRFFVGIAETTNARAAIAQSILVRSLYRQAALLIAAALMVWIVVTRALKPLQKVEAAVQRRSPEDVRPIEHRVPTEIEGLVQTINGLVDRFSASISALQNFTSNASHQFRTPLALIKTHLEIASRQDDESVQKEAIKNAHTAVGDAERLMSQLLLLAKIDSASRENLKAETCNLEDIARDVCEDFVLQLSNNGNKTADLGFEAKGPTNIQADATLTQEVVRNLIDNAIKHGGPKPHIDVSVYRENSRIILEVRDDGPGFILPKSHSRSKAEEKKQFHSNMEGTGLGLSIVREILNLMDGELTAKTLTASNGMIVQASFKSAD